MTNQAPGPRGFPLLGNIPEFVKDPMQMLSRLQREYGNKVHFKLMMQDAYLFSHPAQVEYILRLNSQNFKKSLLFEKISVFLGNGLLTMKFEDKFWRGRRRLSQPPFHRAALEDYIKKWTKTTLHSLDSRWDQYLQQGKSFDVFAEFYRLTTDLAAESLFSLQPDDRDSTVISKALDVGLAYIKYQIESPIVLPQWVPTRKNRQFLKAKGQADEIIHRLINSRQKNLDQSPNDFLTKLMQANSNLDISAEQLRDEVLTMFVAGFETNATALAWCIWCFAQYPDYTDIARREVAKYLAGASPNMANISQLKFLQRFLQECMRLYPPAWWVVRAPIKDDVIGGVEVKANDFIVVSQFVTHRHPQIWPNPQQFDPSRFEDSQVKARHKAAYFPFGDGPRSCIGERFAYLQIQLVIALLLQRYNFHALPGHQVSMLPMATMRPKGGVLVTLSRAGQALPSAPHPPQTEPSK